eukprot:Sspe_Gene.42568::Locus_20680_Transcript_1_1_Confidence_1.000_Length_1610::g.42568::m.42568
MEPPPLSAHFPALRRPRPSPRGSRQLALAAAVTAGLATVFSSFSTLLVYWLGRSSDDFPPPPTVPPAATGNTSATPPPPLDTDGLGALQIIVLQSLIEGLFISTALGLPVLLSHLAQKAEENRLAEAAASALSLSTSSSEEHRMSVDTFTSNELRGIVVNDAWYDDDDGRRRVYFCPKVEYDPPPPPPLAGPPRSCLKRSTQPRVFGTTTAATTAAMALLLSAAEEEELRRAAESPHLTPISLRKAVLLCVGYGSARTVAAWGQYRGLTGQVGLSDTAVLLATTPLWGCAIRWRLGEESLTLQHGLGAVLALAGMVLAAWGNSPFDAIFIVVSAIAMAYAYHLQTVLRRSLHPLLIALSATGVTAVLAGMVQLPQHWREVSGEKWGQVMVLGLVTLVADTTTAATPADIRHAPVGIARALAIALALGLQTAVVDDPPNFPSSLGAITAFSAGVLLEICRMAEDDQRYEQLPGSAYLEPDATMSSGLDQRELA